MRDRIRPRHPLSGTLRPDLPRCSLPGGLQNFARWFVMQHENDKDFQSLFSGMKKAARGRQLFFFERPFSGSFFGSFQALF